MARLIEFPVMADPRGNLCVLEPGADLPFEIKRVFHLYNVPSGAARGGHALKTTHQVLIAVAGAFDVRLKDGEGEQVVTLNRPQIGLHIGPGEWREMDNFSAGCVCLVVASAGYNEADYIRAFDDYLAYRRT